MDFFSLEAWIRQQENLPATDNGDATEIARLEQELEKMRSERERETARLNQIQFQLNNLEVENMKLREENVSFPHLTSSN